LLGLSQHMIAGVPPHTAATKYTQATLAAVKFVLRWHNSVKVAINWQCHTIQYLTVNMRSQCQCIYMPPQKWWRQVSCMEVWCIKRCALQISVSVDSRPRFTKPAMCISCVLYQEPQWKWWVWGVCQETQTWQLY